MTEVVDKRKIGQAKVCQKTVIRYTCCVCGGIFEKQYRSYRRSKMCHHCSLSNRKKTNDDIISVSPYNSDIVNSYGSFQKIKFKCVSCGEDVVIEKRSFDGTFKCGKCKHKETYKNFDDRKRSEIIQKSKKTRLERYGDANYTNEDKRKETNLRKYGVENAFQLKERSKATSMEKYGEPHYTNREKAKITMFERYGGYTWSSDCLRKKCDKTLRERYGEKLEKIVEKVQNTKLERYGDKNYNNVEKSINTCIERYGVSSYSKTNDFIHKSVKKYYYDELYFDSSWELYFWIYATENGHRIIKEPISFQYEYNGDIHYYFPDYLYDGELIEIKGGQFLKNNTLINPYDICENDLYSAKYDCMVRNNVKLITDVSFATDYVDKKYTKDYVKLFSTNVENLSVSISEKHRIGNYLNSGRTIDKEQLSNFWKDKSVIKKLALISIRKNGRCRPIDILDEFQYENKLEQNKNNSYEL